MLSVKGLQVCFPDKPNVPIFSDINLHLAKGEIGCLLGPSGCGKTTLLRTIAGFVSPTQGSINLNQQTVSSEHEMLSVSARSVGMVFQDFALFPHLTVAENIAFGLADLDKGEQQRRVTEYANLVELTPWLDVYPHQLSGGQQQRVALARALAPKPSLILLDEPFSSLDVALREQLAIEIRRLLKSVDATAIIVTHDQQEAFAVADKIAVMEAGKLHQYGTANELYHQPQTRFVASFIGEGIFIPATCLAIADSDAPSSRNRFQTALGELSQGQVFIGQDVNLTPNGRYQLLVRPDDILHDDASEVTATILDKRFRGANILYSLVINDVGAELMLLCLAASHHDHRIGETFGIRLEIDHLVLFPD